MTHCSFLSSGEMIKRVFFLELVLSRTSYRKLQLPTLEQPCFVLIILIYLGLFIVVIQEKYCLLFISLYHVISSNYNHLNKNLMGCCSWSFPFDRNEPKTRMPCCPTCQTVVIFSFSICALEIRGEITPVLGTHISEMSSPR